jgi:anaerobic magnesium-protoporphyrin IX monomethyl ester cyclase
MRKTRVVLTSAPLTLADRYGDYASAANTEPSFGLVSLAASALKAGAEVRLIEASSCSLNVDQTLKAVMDFTPDILGLSATTLGIIPSAELAKAVKRIAPDTITVIGGCHVSALPVETMTEFPAFDIGVIGEGEETLTEIIQAVTSGSIRSTSIPGTCVRTGNVILKNPPRSPIHDLDSLPLPAWHLLDGFPRRFKPSPARIMHWPCASIVMTRGCPNACTFCDRSVFGRKCRSYSSGYAADLCEDLTKNYGVREILIEDDTFIISQGNVARFCEELISRKLNLSWSCLGRADRIELDLLRLMRKAGCWHMSFGIESGDENILKSVNKNLNLDQISSALQNCRSAGIRTKGFFMVGFPGESEASLSATESLVKKLPLDDITVMHLTPFPGSELYTQAQTAGTFDKDWKNMNALNPVFVPHGMTASSLEQARNRILHAFYSRPDVAVRHAAHAIRHPGLIPHYLAGAMTLLKVLRGKTQ